MSDKIDTLTDDEVRQIALLVETLEKSSFDFLQLGMGNLKVTIGKGSVPVISGVPAAVSAVVAPVVPAPVAVPGATPPAVAPVPTTPAQVASGPAADGTVAIVTPMMGRFYARPEPGAAPFVSVGSEVNADTTVGLVEVMKVFTAVRAGVNGVITEICVQDAALVEYGQVLFRVRASAKTQDAGAAGAKGSRKGARS